MVDKDVIFAKVSAIQKYLKRIQEVTKLNPDSLDDEITEDVFVLNLQRAVQSCIDIAGHIVASMGLGVPNSVKENFIKLEESKIIQPELSKKLQAMVGFRNIAIHEYEKIDKAILKSILVKNLRDIEEFYTAVIKHFNL